MKQHIRHLKRHRNILYGFVSILVVIQIVAFITLSSQLAQVHASQLELRQSLNDAVGEVRQENQYQINEISREVSKQRTEFQSQITHQQATLDQQLQALRASPGDFSKVIDGVIKGVVSVNTDKSAGTGFIVHAGGYIITNYHVVQGARFIKVLGYDTNTYDATLVSSDAGNDLALLKITGLFHALTLAESGATHIGEKVIAIGNPLGLSFTVTEGIVSALDRQGPNGMKSYIQTDVTLNPGNSGGPLIDNEGNVIGVNNYKLGDAEGLGFALDSRVVRAFVAAHVPTAP